MAAECCKLSSKKLPDDSKTTSTQRLFPLLGIMWLHCVQYKSTIHRNRPRYGLPTELPPPPPCHMPGAVAAFAAVAALRNATENHGCKHDKYSNVLLPLQDSIQVQQDGHSRHLPHDVTPACVTIEYICNGTDKCSYSMLQYVQLPKCALKS